MNKQSLCFRQALMIWPSGCGYNELQNVSSETSKCIKFSEGLAVIVEMIVL